MYCMCVFLFSINFTLDLCDHILLLVQIVLLVFIIINKILLEDLDTHYCMLFIPISHLTEILKIFSTYLKF